MPEPPTSTPVRRLLPGRPLDAERLEQPRAEVVEQPLPGDLLHQRREHVRARGVVDEERARLVLHRLRRNAATQSPRSGTPLRGVLGVPGRHRQQVPHPHPPQVLVRRPPAPRRRSGPAPGRRPSSSPSATANPTAVDVKLLLSEKSSCSRSGANGAAHPSATTDPCRTTMSECSSGQPTSASTSRSERPRVDPLLLGRGTGQTSQSRHAPTLPPPPTPRSARPSPPPSS